MEKFVKLNIFNYLFSFQATVSHIPEPMLGEAPGMCMEDSGTRTRVFLPSVSLI